MAHVILPIPSVGDLAASMLLVSGWLRAVESQMKASGDDRADDAMLWSRRCREAAACLYGHRCANTSHLPDCDGATAANCEPVPAR
jgi:hypothetical protein